MVDFDKIYPNRNLDERPYTADEMKVCAYLQRITNNEIGCGDDPIGFLITSHSALRIDLDATRKSLEGVRKHLREVLEDRTKK